MKLTDAEKAMFDGTHGKAKQKAMDLLVRYGEALECRAACRREKRRRHLECGVAGDEAIRREGHGRGLLEVQSRQR